MKILKIQKKIVGLAPVAALSTAIFLSPIATFAAEKPQTTQQEQSIFPKKDVAPQEHVIQGYLIKNGIKTPVYKDSKLRRENADPAYPAYPELSSNPNDPAPDQGPTASEEGQQNGKTLYFSKISGILCHLFGSGKSYENVYIEQIDSDTYQMGNFNPDTLERTNDTTVNDSTNVLKRLFNGTKIKRDNAFKKIGASVVPKDTAYTFSQAVTAGLSTADSIGAAKTLGAKVGISGGGLSGELSAQLTTNFNHTITVTNQTTNTQTLQHPKAPDSYQNANYMGAVYQLSSTYTVEPGSFLQERLGDGNTLSQVAFNYSDATLYLTVTPGAST